jgi:hypothetical protein
MTHNDDWHLFCWGGTRPWAFQDPLVIEYELL